MKKFELREWSRQEEDMVEGYQVGRIVKEMERLSLAHTLKGGGKEEIVEDM